MKIQRCKGMRDLSPAEMVAFRFVEGICRECFIKWGYREVRTPTIEYLHLFTSAGTLTPGRLGKVYSFLDWDGWSGERVVLRPDGTIPVARLYAESVRRGLARLFYAANIFMFEETGAQTRETWQCGAELIGKGSATADAELVALSLEVLASLGLKNIELRLSHAGLLKVVLEKLAFSPEERHKILDRILDGDAGALAMVSRESPGAENLLRPLLNRNGHAAGLLRRQRSALNRGIPGIARPLDDFLETIAALDELGFKYKINIASGTGFEYYTGLIFQLFIGGEKVGGGGRYDALIPAMGGGDVPASGFALYIDRLMALVNATNNVPVKSGKVLVRMRVGGSLREAFRAAAGLRRAGYIAELDLGKKAGAGPTIEMGGKGEGITLREKNGKSKQIATIADAVKILGEKGERRMTIKIALPKGRLLRRTAAMLQKAGWGLDEYHAEMGFYRPKSQKFPGLLIRVFHEKDIPIQIAMGNYDLGICGLDWVEELGAKYPSSDLVKVGDLGYGHGALYAAASSWHGAVMRNNGDLVRIASEYPNLAEAYALRRRMGRFAIFPVWGGAEAYPPENADIVLVSGTIAGLAGCGLAAGEKVLDFSACLIANRNSLKCRSLDEVIESIRRATPPERKPHVGDEVENKGTALTSSWSGDAVRLALPDGHQQEHVVNMFNRSGINVMDYPSATGNRRPGIDIKGVTVKVIRPQDMPLQVANGNFDLAISGRDWLDDHLAQFPASPVKEILDLKSGRVRLVAVVSRELPVDSTEDLRRLVAAREAPVRIASEYMNLADKYARDNHLGHYRIIPTWGATEAFLPEDADLLIENTETGRTIGRHNLKIIDTLFESTGCLIGPARSTTDPKKSRTIRMLIDRLRSAVENAT